MREAGAGGYYLCGIVPPYHTTVVGDATVSTAQKPRACQIGWSVRALPRPLLRTGKYLRTSVPPLTSAPDAMARATSSGGGSPAEMSSPSARARGILEVTADASPQMRSPARHIGGHSGTPLSLASLLLLAQSGSVHAPGTGDRFPHRVRLFVAVSSTIRSKSTWPSLPLTVRLSLLSTINVRKIKILHTESCMHSIQRCMQEEILSLDTALPLLRCLRRRSVWRSGQSNRPGTVLRACRHTRCLGPFRAMLTTRTGNCNQCTPYGLPPQQKQSEMLPTLTTRGIFCERLQHARSDKTQQERHMRCFLPHNARSCA